MTRTDFEDHYVLMRKLAVVIFVTVTNFLFINCFIHFLIDFVLGNLKSVFLKEDQPYSYIVLIFRTFPSPLFLLNYNDNEDVFWFRWSNILFTVSYICYTRWKVSKFRWKCCLHNLFVIYVHSVECSSRKVYLYPCILNFQIRFRLWINLKLLCFVYTNSCMTKFQFY